MEDSRKRLENLEQDLQEVSNFVSTSTRSNVKLHLLEYQSTLNRDIQELKKKIELLQQKQDNPEEKKVQKEKTTEYTSISKYMFENNKDNVK